MTRGMGHPNGIVREPLHKTTVRVAAASHVEKSRFVRSTCGVLDAVENHAFLLGCGDACEPTIKSRQSTSSIDVAWQRP